MADDVVFKNDSDPNIGQNQSSQQGSRVTLDDLYGPSGNQQPAIPPSEISVAPPQQVPVENNTQSRYEEIPPDPNLIKQAIKPIPNDSSLQVEARGADAASPIPENIAPMGITPDAFEKRKKKKLFMMIGGGIAFLSILLIGIAATYFFPSKGAATNANITYWGLWEDQRTMQLVITEFEKNNPGIKIDYKKQDSKQYKDRLITRITNNTGPDIFTYHNSWVPTVTNVLAPLPNDVVTTEEFKKQYFPVVQQDLIKNGALYGLPQGIDTLALFINKELFDAAGLEVPQTWDDFTRAARVLTVKDERGAIKTAGTALGTYDNITHAPDIISLLFLQNNIKLSEFSKHPESIGATLDFYTDFAKHQENVWDNTLNPSQLAFANGELAMYFGYSWDIFAIKNINPQLVFEVHTVPNVPDKKTAIASYWVNGVSNKSTHQKEAMLFIKHLGSKEVLQKLYSESAKTRLFGQPYARRDLAQTLKDEPLVYPFLLQAEYAQSTYFASDTKDSAYNDRLNTYLGNAIRGIVTGSSPQSVTETLVNGVTQVQSGQ